MLVEVKTVGLSHLGETTLTSCHTQPIIRKLLASAEKLPEGGCLVIDFSGVELLSFKLCAEISNFLIHARSTRLKKGGPFRRKSLVLSNLNTECHEAVDGVLQLKKEAVLVLRTDQPPEIIGHYPEFLRNTFKIVRAHQPVTAAQVAHRLKIKVAAAAERLRRLTDWGFVARSSKASTRRPIYQYEVVNPGRRDGTRRRAR